VFAVRQNNVAKSTILKLLISLELYIGALVLFGTNTEFIAICNRPRNLTFCCKHKD